MKPISGRRIARIMEHRGWTLDRINGSHHVYVHPEFPRSVPVPIHGNRDLRPSTQRTIMKAVGLTDTDL
jgi:predicted RNA binding protein YcfA (HicA-like mRNA interferase family)